MHKSKKDAEKQHNRIQTKYGTLKYLNLPTINMYCSKKNMVHITKAIQV